MICLLPRRFPHCQLFKGTLHCFYPGGNTEIFLSLKAVALGTELSLPFYLFVSREALFFSSVFLSPGTFRLFA